MDGAGKDYTEWGDPDPERKAARPHSSADPQMWVYMEQPQKPEYKGTISGVGLGAWEELGLRGE